MLQGRVHRKQPPDGVTISSPDYRADTVCDLIASHQAASHQKHQRPQGQEGHCQQHPQANHFLYPFSHMHMRPYFPFFHVTLTSYPSFFAAGRPVEISPPPWLPLQTPFYLQIAPETSYETNAAADKYHPGGNFQPPDTLPETL